MESPGDPNIEPKSQDFQKKISLGVLPRACGKEFVKITILGAPRRLKMRLALKHQLDFHFSKGLPKSTQTGAKMDPQRLPNPTQNAPKSIQERSRKIHKK